MNISTGGPHILLFERDQQLTALISSEFQLAGYECHAARTAVEVFDALARHPIRIVLVNLAQAAAARREFWVALDTQRRGRGIHVLTFHCTNLAGYGPHDPDERQQAADIEVDGMIGVMKLVEEVQTRVPGVSTSTGTMPRVARVTPPPAPAPITATAPRVSPSAMPTNGTLSSGTAYRQAAGIEPSVAPLPQPAARSTPTATPQQPITQQVVSTPVNTQPGTASSRPSSYTDKIRAVLYPNQRNWSNQGTANGQQETKFTFDIQAGTAQTVAPQPSFPAPEATVLQQLANGKTSIEEPMESALSGLAQLSRMVQESHAAAEIDSFDTDPNSAYQLADHTQIASYHAEEERPRTNTGPITYTITPSIPVAPPPPVPASPAIPITPAAQKVPNENAIGTQPLRASPINDIPVERAFGGQSEGARRPDVLSRMNYGQQAAQTTIPPLASISTPMPVPPPMVPPTPVQKTPTPSYTATKEEYNLFIEESQPEQIIAQEIQESPRGIEERREEQSISKEQDQLETLIALNQELNAEQNGVANNAVLIDIMESLPPMPPIKQQSREAQPQVLSGRATRSLGSVLLAGHLVPQNRLEVAQNVQRMLRGVDLNYQLGEILLMFKLLTPDQLLAASLVSYGLITTAQISALGRIRQELHSIGLEYDLENLLILFRILTPEQLREVKTSWQG